MRSLHIGQKITIRENQSLDKYLSEINKISLISIDEEVQLANRISKGDQLALQELVSANLRFVVSVAKQYQNQGLSLADLINEGNIGLIKAASKFDVSRGFKFISYAVWWIRQAIIQALTVNSRIVRLPLNKINVLNKIRIASDHFEQVNYRPPSTEELCNIINSTYEEVELCLMNTGSHVSMDKPINDDNSFNKYDFIKSEKFPDPDQDLILESIQTDLKAVLNNLSFREAEVLRLYYGIGSFSPMSLSEIAKLLEITRERVRQIKELAILSIKSSNRGKILLKYLG